MPVFDKNMQLHELIYCDNRNEYQELQTLIQGQFPNAKFSDGSDDIHQYRFQVESETIEQDEFHKFAIQNKFALSCFSFQLDMYGNGERVKRLIAEAQEKA